MEQACSTCKIVFPATAEYFYKEKTKTSGLRSSCIVCTRARSRERAKEKYWEDPKRERLRSKHKTQKEKREVLDGYDSAEYYWRDINERRDANRWKAFTNSLNVHLAGEKKCKSCGQVRDVENFGKDKHTNDRLLFYCKSCNRSKYIEKQEEAIEKRRDYYKNNKAKCLNRNKKSYEKYKVQYLEQKKEYYAKNKDRIIASNAIRAKQRRQTDTGYRIKDNLYARVNDALRRNQNIKSDSLVSLIGCTIPYLVKHLESMFKDGMSWENYGRTGWHVDHIVPCMMFDLADPEQQKLCFHYTNMQPLWAEDNLRKGSKLIYTKG